MKKLIVAVLAWNVISAVNALACTTLLVTKEASKDGSVMVGHSDDSELFDQRLVQVPAADHKPGSLRPVYYDASAIGDKPQYHTYELRRYVGTDRGPVYDEPDRPQSIPLGYIPQVEHTYSYFEGSYAIMNEHQVMFGECTDGTKLQPDPVPGKLIFYSAELSRVAAERCTTARQAVELIGSLIETYGYYGTGETLPIGDTKEGWVIEMAPSPEGTGGLWVAKKVPEGEVFFAANELRIREIDPGDPNTLYSKDLHAIAQKHGWWKPEDGKLDWLRTVSLGEYSHPYYSLRRVWRLQSRVAPSKAQSPWVKNGFTKKFPFSIKPDQKLSARDVMGLYRDYYQGTEFDLSKGVTAGPFGSPYRYPGPMDAGGSDTGDPNAKLKGGWERPISIFRCGFSYICQARDWLPDPIGGLLWFGPDEPMSTAYVPFYVGVTRIAKPYYTVDTTAFSQDSAWWAFNFVANWAGLKYSYIIKDIQQKQDEIELAALFSIEEMDKQAVALYKQDPAKVPPLLTEYCETQANQVVKDWWKLAWELVARYDDGYVNAPEKMAQEVGYPKEWYEKSEWSNGPKSYKKLKSIER
ncbi:MAG: C69 family dipeptidase [Proteobacteria bacterium]|nr:dipeptidase [Desulfocapsa sp.]MBU3943478.1 C69 family dipeptidase [Pseudomonadota bacterium]MCG2743490.1 C69 family dipeptidase [Desulfobacteraceae bacterium]MBU3983664.1 C69 family dipeptidase [Pseudomonadota bacterium]MBU4029298.1 C69 family dipeptidase [Pseudomonadota bacterium]